MHYADVDQCLRHFAIKWLNMLISLEHQSHTSTTNATKFGSDIYGVQWMHDSDFGDPSFHPAPSPRQSFNLSKTFVHDEIPAKPMTFSSASVVV